MQHIAFFVYAIISVQNFCHFAISMSYTGTKLKLKLGLLSERHLSWSMVRGVRRQRLPISDRQKWSTSSSVSAEYCSSSVGYGTATDTHQGRGQHHFSRQACGRRRASRACFVMRTMLPAPVVILCTATGLNQGLTAQHDWPRVSCTCNTDHQHSIVRHGVLILYILFAYFIINHMMRSLVCMYWWK